MKEKYADTTQHTNDNTKYRNNRKNIVNIDLKF